MIKVISGEFANKEKWAIHYNNEVDLHYFYRSVETEPELVAVGSFEACEKEMYRLRQLIKETVN